MATESNQEKELFNEALELPQPKRRPYLEAVTAVLAVLLSLLLGIAATTWQALRAIHLRQQADVNAHAARDAQREAERQRTHAEHMLYIANMNLAQAAWEQKNVGLVRQLLNDTAGYAGRGFEWSYWQRQTHLEISTFHGHASAVCSVAFSPDGERVVSGSWDFVARVSEAVTGKELLVLRGHQGAVQVVTYSHDGKRILTGSLDKTARIWDAVTGEPLLTIAGQQSEIYSAAFAPDGQRVVTGSKDGHAEVWDPRSGGRLLILHGHTNCLNAVDFSPD